MELLYSLSYHIPCNIYIEYHTYDIIPGPKCPNATMVMLLKNGTPSTYASNLPSCLPKFNVLLKHMRKNE